ncbi:MAG: signal recognition particle subunit SRP19/SEC65 family protein [Methanomassiliicoccales archaeon]
MYAKGKWILWPSYIDAKLKRKEGRRVNRKTAIEAPTVQMMAEALKKLGYECEVDEGASYPARWYRKEGRVIVDAKEPKSHLLKKLCDEIKRS